MQNEPQVIEEIEELVELGVASEETRGGFGFTWDGSAMGRRWP